MFSINFTKSAAKELRILPVKTVQAIGIKIDGLSEEPRPDGCKKLKGYRNLWRIRSGDYRIVYSIEDEIKIVEIRRIRHRKDVYEE